MTRANALARSVRRGIAGRINNGRAAIPQNDDHELLFANEMETHGRDINEYPGVVTGSTHDPDREVWRGQSAD
jgi:hypothetical protein